MQCGRFNEHVLEMVRSRPDIKVVVLAGSWPMAPEDIFLPTNFKGDASITSRSEHAAYLLQGIRAEIKDLEALHKKVIVVDDNPSLHFDPISMYRYADLPIRRAIVDYLLDHPVQNPLATSVARSTVLNPEAEEVRRQVLTLAQKDPDLAVIDTKSLFCSASTCLVADDGHLLYVDNNHISSFAESKVVAGIAAIQEHQFSGLRSYSENGVDVSQSH
jgi:hypothetical protein